MSEKPAQKLSESDDFTDNSVDNANDAVREDTSQQSGLATVESEYDTASDSPSDGEEYDEQEEESESGEEEELAGSEDEEEEEEEGDDGSDDDVIEVLDYERQSGDGQEQEADSKRKVDDDEDRSNPQYIPKKGTFYEHDDRTVEDEDDGKDADDENVNNEDPSGVSGERKGIDKNAASKTMKKWQASADRWTHDRFDECEQAPKSRAELVSAYGYDIRSEDGPPRARRRRRYARGPNKYTRNWEDEDAYSKSNSNPEHNRLRKVPRPEDFPELGTNSGKLRSNPNSRRLSKQGRASSINDRLDDRSSGRQRPERRISERNRASNSSRSIADRDRGIDRDRYEQRLERVDRMDRERDRDRNWDRDRDYDQQDGGNYRDARTDGSRYSSDRVSNSYNKENKINNRSSKEKDRRGPDYKVITSLQFKNQSRNKNAESGMVIAGAGGVGGVTGQAVHGNSVGALSGSSNSNKMNNAMDRVQNVPDRMLDQRALQHHYQNQPPQIMSQQQMPPTQSQQQVQQTQPPPQQIQQHHPQTAYVSDDHYDSYSESKMPKDAKFPYNPPANATIQSVEIGQTDIAKYPPPATQRTTKDRQQVLPTTGGMTLNARSQISPRQIVSTQASQLTTISTTQQQQLVHQQQQQQLQQQSQQQQYQQMQQQQQQYQQQLHTLTNQTAPPVASQAPQTQIPPPQLPQQQAPSSLPQPAQMHNVHLAGSLANTAVSQQQLMTGDNSSRSSKRYSSLRQRTTMDNPNVVVVQSPLHEQQQQQLLQQQQQQQLLLQQELQHQQQQKLSAQATKPSTYQINQPPQQATLPLTLQSEYLVQTANQPNASNKPQSVSQAPVQYQHPAGYYTATTPTAGDFVTGSTTQQQPPQPQQQQPPSVATVPVVPQPQNALLTGPQYPQYSQSNTAAHQYIQAPPPAAYIPQTTATPQPTPPAAPAAPPPQILNYVPAITPTAPSQYPPVAAPYPAYQNYNAVVPQPVAPAVPQHTPSPSAATAALYQSSGGITYYAPQSQTQAPRPLPSQRRPTSAIPILAPPDRKTKNNRSSNDPAGGSGNENEENGGASVNSSGGGMMGAAATSSGGNAPVGSDIDHILDNMFVQRPPYQPPTRKSPSPAPTSASATISGSGVSTVNKLEAATALPSDAPNELEKEAIDKIGDSVKNLTIQEEKLPIVDPLAGASVQHEKLEITPTAVDTTAG
ncbi:ataxin-2 homolog [Malaya genurostris]|uniref:ataxin-2 homolog n=1 Tax=Malaya genurostris TaxID=325434 RepID=UPI0026F3B022|nr:ataxin-2 homolog [Malaya genurostris]